MEEQLGLLIQLQEIDTKLHSRREQKNQLPEILAALEQRRIATQEVLDTAKEALLTAQKNKREREKDLEVGAQKVEKHKARTSEIKTNKEYQALLKEIEAAEQENKAIEDDILTLMEKIENAAAQIIAAEQKTKEEESAIQAERKEQEVAFAKLDEELNALEQTRQETISRIQPLALAQYQKLFLTKGGVAMAEVRGESCSGCYMSIPPQVFVNVKKNENIITCPHCNRILYYKESIVQNTI